MEFKALSLQGVIEIIPRVFEDERGFFFESYNEKVFKENGIADTFVQDNQSFSLKNVVRGLHYQNAPYAQAKLVRVISGQVLDVIVDIRPDSATYGQHLKVILDAQKQNMLYVPAGFAHGFTALEDTVFVYKCTNLYNKASESGIYWADETLDIDWEVENPIVSEKDRILPRFN
ncbi:dTDP-4-dehydrorhamnose 3,5-epimerase [Flexibacter flexilis DSM 6793]|uniref:dTDP-4-dehydrorhamnose 3,5-epimerase n=1 Tax=Flexibacter flexilis DSM 6793 TaxID=927664 RepID=A0A1I1G533_9BACT|nr:dTDP-4-dehydrorhamnose 3,5-epimerase [Flexibacter flexilis]SFC04403.1 dTDP-4-dehydrorhamnose 3,5-epimerase [Flexibacter flexilis DSM 6793]